MSFANDNDRALVEELCEAYGFELDRWQKRALALILASHRTGARWTAPGPRVWGYNRNVPTSAPVRMNDQIEGRCNTPAPPESGAPWTRCVKKGPHHEHYNGAYRWRNEALGSPMCSSRAPNIVNTFCELRDDGHEMHKNGDMHWT